MNTMRLQQMTSEKKTQQLDRLFRTCQEGFKQSLRALEARRFSVAAGTLDRLSKALADISILMFEGKERSLSIEVKIKEKLEELKKNTSAFQAAVELNSVKDARAFSRWGIEYVSELAELD